MISQYDIDWIGPYRWFGTENESILAAPQGRKAGIYLWAIPFQGKFLTYYVGETGESFADRMVEHAQYYLNGFYRVYDPDEFARGRKTLIWNGRWKPDRKDPQTMLEFLNQYPLLSTKIYAFLEKLRFFLAPLDVERRVRQRIEAAIASELLKQKDVIGSFPDADIRYWPRRADDRPILVKMKSHELILGFASELTA